jgi:hypothetical protein
MSPPITAKKITATQKNSGDALARSFHVDLGVGRPMDGLIFTQP